MVSPSPCHHVPSLSLTPPLLSLHSIPPSLSDIALLLRRASEPACLRPTTNSRPSRMPAYAPPRMRFRSSSPSRATSSPSLRGGSTPMSARRFVPATSTFGRTAARPPWIMAASPWSDGTLVPLLCCVRCFHACPAPPTTARTDGMSWGPSRIREVGILFLSLDLFNRLKRLHLLLSPCRSFCFITRETQLKNVSLVVGGKDHNTTFP
jgi:hypothetical protein